MKLLELQVENYKVINNFSIDFKNNLSVIIGKNGAGKTTFYEIITSIFSALHRWESDAGVSKFKLKYEIKTPSNTNSKSPFIDKEKLEITITEGQTSNHPFNISINDTNYSKAEIEENFGDIYFIIPDLMIYYSGFSDRLKQFGDVHEKLYVNEFKPNTKKRLFFDEMSRITNRELFYFDVRKHFEILSAAYLSLQYSTQADDFLRNSLGLKKSENNFLVLDITRPSFLTKGDVDNFWGASGQMLRFLELLGKHSNIFLKESNEKIRIYFNLENWYALRAEYVEEKVLFYLLDMLQAAKMLTFIEVQVSSIDKGKNIEIGDLSDGQQQLLITNAFFELFANEDLLVLMDEPDVYLHPSWQGKFIQQLQVSDSSHYIISTHSPFLLSHYDGEEVHLFKNGRVENTARYYGREIKEILLEMGEDNISFRPKEIEEKIDKLFRKIGEAQTEEALADANNFYEKLLEEIGEGEDDLLLQRAKSEINYKKFELKNVGK